MIEAGVEFDPAQAVIGKRRSDDELIVFIFDGAHRFEAHKKAGKVLPIEVVGQGDQDTAMWLALAANQKHGLRRSQKDKARAVRLALEHEQGAKLSDREIARHCGVDHKTVGRVRRELEASGEIPQVDEREVTRNGSTFTQKVAEQPAYLEIWELDRRVTGWLKRSFNNLPERISALTNVKQKRTSRLGQDLFDELVQYIPEPHRKGDLVQACNNRLAQLKAQQRIERANELIEQAAELTCYLCGEQIVPYASSGVPTAIRCKACEQMWTSVEAFGITRRSHEQQAAAEPEPEQGGGGAGERGSSEEWESRRAVISREGLFSRYRMLIFRADSRLLAALLDTLELFERTSRGEPEPEDV
jgi:hypothetical protein